MKKLIMKFVAKLVMTPSEDRRVTVSKSVITGHRPQK